MIKYTNWNVVFQEVPDEVSLAFNLSNCPIRCPECHSKWLWDDVGSELNIETLDEIISGQLSGITCVALMGGDADVPTVLQLSKHIRSKYDLKVAWYSGRNDLPKNPQLSYDLMSNLDYIKLGPYISSCGGLDSPTTNQRFYQVTHCDPYHWPTDITFKFRKHE